MAFVGFYQSGLGPTRFYLSDRRGADYRAATTHLAIDALRFPTPEAAQAAVARWIGGAVLDRFPIQINTKTGHWHLFEVVRNGYLDQYLSGEDRVRLLVGQWSARISALENSSTPGWRPGWAVQICCFDGQLETVTTPSVRRTRFVGLEQALSSLPVLAKWHLQEWADAPLLSDRQVVIVARHSDNGLPKTFVALRDTLPVGFVSIVSNNLSERPDIGPWVATLLVSKAERGMGVGRDLLAHAVSYIAECGFDFAYLHTTEAVEYYRRLGWERIGSDNGKTIFRLPC